MPEPVTKDTWMGFSTYGAPIQISHAKLMDWAYDNDKQITVGWSHSFERKGQRLVRGEHVKEAIKAGWLDIAKGLANHFDECPGFQIQGDNFSGCTRSGGDCPTCGS